MVPHSYKISFCLNESNTYICLPYATSFHFYSVQCVQPAKNKFKRGVIACIIYIARVPYLLNIVNDWKNIIGVQENKIAWGCIRKWCLVDFEWCILIKCRGLIYQSTIFSIFFGDLNTAFRPTNLILDIDSIAIITWKG